MAIRTLALLASSLTLPCAAEQHWAVIAAGSNTYSNYRHQADACHAMQLAKARGIPAERIITMIYDDIADNRLNRIPGKVFNRPSDNEDVDVYDGCQIDYSGSEITPTVFLNILTGTSNGAGKKVLQSGPDDHVFIFFVDHGAPGIVSFVGGTMHKAQMQAALQTMKDQQMFSQVAFYMETCESGSMFEGMDIEGIYAVSASGTDEPSWGTYCDSSDTVAGIDLGSCLGDLFAVSWMETLDNLTALGQTITLQEHFEVTRDLTDKSKVMQWGDVSFTDENAQEFIGGVDGGKVLSDKSPTKSEVSSRLATIFSLRRQLDLAENDADRDLIERLIQWEEAAMEHVHSVFARFREMAAPSDPEMQAAIEEGRQKPGDEACEMGGHNALREHCGPIFKANGAFALGYHQQIVNVCHEVASGLNFGVSGALQTICADSVAEAMGEVTV